MINDLGINNKFWPWLMCWQKEPATRVNWWKRQEKQDQQANQKNIIRKTKQEARQQEQQPPTTDCYCPLSTFHIFPLRSCLGAPRLCRQDRCVFLWCHQRPDGEEAEAGVVYPSHAHDEQVLRSKLAVWGVFLCDKPSSWKQVQLGYKKVPCQNRFGFGWTCWGRNCGDDSDLELGRFEWGFQVVLPFLFFFSLTFLIGSLPQRWFRITAAQHDLGYQPVVSYQEGWPDTIEWFRTQKIWWFVWWFAKNEKAESFRTTVGFYWFLTMDKTCKTWRTNRQTKTEVACRNKWLPTFDPKTASGTTGGIAQQTVDKVRRGGNVTWNLFG